MSHPNGEVLRVTEPEMRHNCTLRTPVRSTMDSCQSLLPAGALIDLQDIDFLYLPRRKCSYMIHIMVDWIDIEKNWGPTVGVLQ